MTLLLKHAWDDPTVAWVEDDHQMAVVQFLRRHGVDVAADQNAGRRSLSDGAKRKAMGMTAGEPDLRLYLPGGRLVLVEMKKWRGTLSKEQEARHPKLQALGFPVHVIAARTPEHAVAQIVDILATYGVP